jgi:hypothetical protein
MHSLSKNIHAIVLTLAFAVACQLLDVGRFRTGHEAVA